MYIGPYTGNVSVHWIVHNIVYTELYTGLYMDVKLTVPSTVQGMDGTQDVHWTVFCTEYWDVPLDCTPGDHWTVH